MRRRKPGSNEAGMQADPRWAAVLARDARADGTFVYSVRTTGVYCRPSCPARRAHPRNVLFHATAADAERAGFRPCRRCRPQAESAHAELAAAVARACRFIDCADSIPSAADIAAHAGTGVRTLNRWFRAATGVTPLEYARAARAARLRAHLGAAADVTGAMHEAGFGSSARFYGSAGALLGMTPTRWRAGGAGVTIHHAIGPSSLGPVLVACTGRGICAILLGDGADALARELRARFPRAQHVPGDALLAGRLAEAIALVEDPARGHDLPLDLRGTLFQHRVWRELQSIPAGGTATYSGVAARIGAPGAARAVAAACAANPAAVAVPCHRVVREDGDLAGYRWGLARKRALLEREKRGRGTGS
ncbi:MAG: bifunctional DNA-binding transcriptional regulator/O6-methylguanine-DNA methyltransferase Ada [Gammaproteobacteria bacterium]